MIRVLGGLAAILISLISGACTCNTVEPGYVGVLVHTRGSEQSEFETRGVGRHYDDWYTEFYKFPTFTQTHVWDRSGQNNNEFVFQTIEGAQVTADIGVTFSIDQAKIIELFKTYRRGVEEITDVYIRNIIRDAVSSRASQMKVEQIAGGGRTALMDAIFEDVKAKLEPSGLLIETVYLVSPIRVSDRVREAIDSKIAAIQRAEQRENELKEAEAEGQKLLAQTRAEVEALRLRAESMTDAVFRSEALANQKRAIEKWNGVLPGVTGGGQIPFIQIPAP